MKKLYTLIVIILITSINYAQKINEFYPNPPGSDPAFNEVELKGPPNTAFNYWLVSIESDVNSSRGVVDRSSNISGTFDSNGLDVVLIPDLEDPSFTLVLSTNFNGSQGDDLDTNDDGIIDNIAATFGSVVDAIGISDSYNDDGSLYGNSLGGSNVLFNGLSKPELMFRDGLMEDWFVVVDTNPFPDQTNYSVHEADGNQVNINNFDIDPTSSTFNVTNPSRETQNTNNVSIDALKIYPNPNTSGLLYIKGLQNGPATLSIFDLLGKLVHSKEIIYHEPINVSTLQSGSYIMRLTTNSTSMTHKLIIN